MRSFPSCDHVPVSSFLRLTAVHGWGDERQFWYERARRSAG